MALTANVSIIRRGGRGGKFIPGVAVPLGAYNKNKLKVEPAKVEDVNPWIRCDGCHKVRVRVCVCVNVCMCHIAGAYSAIGSV